jgi:hypothetical protein
LEQVLELAFPLAALVEMVEAARMEDRAWEASQMEAAAQ